MDIDEVRGYLDGLEITGCALRDTGEIAFIAQDWTIVDPMEPHKTDVFVFLPFKKEGEQWGSAGLGTCRDMYVCPSYAQKERWLFVTNIGEIFVVRNDGSDFENPVSSHSKFIFGVKTICYKNSYFVGPNRAIIKRIKMNTVTRIDTEKLKTIHPIKRKGFRDIDGFSDDDLYACGGLGDFWHYDRSQWRFIDLSTNVPLDHVCCGSNGVVYILATNRFLFFGRKNQWSEYRFDTFSDLVGDIKWYKDRLLILTETNCYELIDNKLHKSKIIDDSPLKYYSYLSCCNEKMVLMNGTEGAYFDGVRWIKFL